MKTGYIITGLAVLALAISCNDLPVKSVGTQVKINQEGSIDGDAFLGIEGNKHVESTTDGKLIVRKASNGSVTPPASQSGSSKVDGSLNIETGDLPKVATPDNGSSQGAGIIITIKNPDSVDVQFSGDSNVNGNKSRLPETVAPAGQETSVLYCDNRFSDSSTADAARSDTVVEVDADFTLNPPANSDNGSGNNNNSSGVVIDNMELSRFAHTSVAQSAASNVTISAAYFCPLTFSKGTTFTFHETFGDLGIELPRENYPLKSYDLNITIENPYPYDITFSASSPEGISATCENVVKAATGGSPVKTDIVLHITDNSGRNISNIDEASIDVTFTAPADNASFKKGGKIGVNVDRLIVRSL